MRSGLLSLLPAAALGAGAVEFDGERYPSRFTSGTADIRLAEYVRGGESLENWTRLVAVRHFARLTDPKDAAIDLARTVRAHNPQAKFQILTSNDGAEAQIDFLTWARESAQMEFNVFRYFRAPGYPGLISYQFAYRFSDRSSAAVETLKANRQRWIREMIKAKFEIDFGR